MGLVLLFNFIFRQIQQDNILNFGEMAQLESQNVEILYQNYKKVETR